MTTRYLYVRVNVVFKQLITFLKVCCSIKICQKIESNTNPSYWSIFTNILKIITPLTTIIIKRCFNKASLNCLSLALLVLIYASMQTFRLRISIFFQYHYPILAKALSLDPRQHWWLNNRQGLATTLLIYLLCNIHNTLLSS